MLSRLWDTALLFRPPRKMLVPLVLTLRHGVNWRYNLDVSHSTKWYVLILKFPSIRGLPAIGPWAPDKPIQMTAQVGQCFIFSLKCWEPRRPAGSNSNLFMRQQAAGLRAGSAGKVCHLESNAFQSPSNFLAVILDKNKDKCAGFTAKTAVCRKFSSATI